MRCFEPGREVKAGKYRIISAATRTGNDYLVISRGGVVQLLIVPSDIIVMDEKLKNANLLEIKEGGGFKIPTVRYAQADEMKTVDEWEDPKGTTRRGLRVEV